MGEKTKDKTFASNAKEIFNIAWEKRALEKIFFERVLSQIGKTILKWLQDCSTNGLGLRFIANADNGQFDKVFFGHCVPFVAYKSAGFHIFEWEVWKYVLKNLEFENNLRTSLQLDYLGANNKWSRL